MGKKPGFQFGLCGSWLLYLSRRPQLTEACKLVLQELPWKGFCYAPTFHCSEQIELK